MPPLASKQPMLLNTRQPPVRNALSNDKKDGKDDKKSTTMHEKRLSNHGLIAPAKSGNRLPLM